MQSSFVEQKILHSSTENFITNIIIHLGDDKNNLSMLNKKSKSGTMRSVSVECQFLLCLTILRRNYGYQV